jgi:hypothetical protein
MKRYKIDRLASNVLDAAMAAIDAVKDDVPQTIHGALIWRDTADTFIPSKVLLYLHEGKPRSFEQADFKLDLHLLKTAIPPSLPAFLKDGDPIRAAFIKAHRLKKNLDWWGQPLFVPRLLVAVEIDHVVRPAIKGRMEDLDLAVGAAFDLYDGNPSSITHAVAEGEMDKAIHKDLRLKLHTDNQRLEFAETCYEAQARRDWLAKLAGV